jgi:HSP20 family protein
MVKKPSFFQKLTGANEDNEDEEGDEEKNEAIETAEENEAPAENENPVQRENIPNETPVKKTVIKNAEKNKPRAKKITNEKNSMDNATEKTIFEKDWPTEAEGQLTIDVYQTPSDIIIKSTVAGVKPEELDIAISNDMVTIKGYRKKDEEIKAEDYYYQECYWGAFSRSVILPVDVESDKAEAGIKNGILTIRLPKIEKIRTKKIKVKLG